MTTVFRRRSAGLGAAPEHSRPEPGESDWRSIDYSLAAALRDAAGTNKAIEMLKGVPSTDISSYLARQRVVEKAIADRLRKGERIEEPMFVPPGCEPIIPSNCNNPLLLDYCFANHGLSEGAGQEKYVSPFEVLPVVQRFREDITLLKDEQILRLDKSSREIGIVNGECLFLCQGIARNLYVPVKEKRSFDSENGRWADYNGNSQFIFVYYDFLRNTTLHPERAIRYMLANGGREIYLGDELVNEKLRKL